MAHIENQQIYTDAKSYVLVYLITLPFATKLI